MTVKVECTTVDGRKELIAKDRLVFRPSVYAIVTQKGEVLLLNIKSTGTYPLPGGGVDVGERLIDALRRG